MGLLKLFKCNITKNTANQGNNGGYFSAGGTLEMDSKSYIYDNTPKLISCNIGEYRNPSLTCSSCFPGKYQDEINFGGCKLCEVGKTININNASSCKECLIGEYQDILGQTNCKRCVAGRYGNISEAINSDQCPICPKGKWSLSGLTECYACSPGKYSNKSGLKSNDDCTPTSIGKYGDVNGNIIECPIGQYQNEIGATSCKLCEAGNYNNRTGQSSCNTKCEAGKYSLDGASFCQICPGGRISTKIGSSSSNNCNLVPLGKYAISNTKSMDCPSGRYADVQGLSSCKLCGAGRYNDKIGQWSCNQVCWFGKFSLAGATNCQDCPSGRFSSSVGLRSRDECVPAPVGKYLDSNGLKVNCPVGQYQNENGTTFCKLCEAGKYNDKIGQISCDNICESGKYSQVGASSCTECPAGRIGSNLFIHKQNKQCKEACKAGTYSTSGSTDCLQCQEGRYSNTGSSGCKLCEAGKYNDKIGQSICKDNCKIGFYSSVGSRKCEKCPGGYKGIKLNATSLDDGCVKCPQGKYYFYIKFTFSY